MVCRGAIAALIGLAVISAGAAQAQVGPYGILPTAHGYNSGTAVLVPARPVVEWAGGSLSYRKPNISIQAPGRSIALKLASRQAQLNGTNVALKCAPTVYDGVLCVGARDLCGLLGIGMEYVDRYRAVRGADGAETPSAFERLGGVPHLALSRQGRQATVLVHKATPGVVRKVIADLENTSQCDLSDPEVAFDVGAFGTNWVLQVTAVRSGYFLSSVPAALDTEMSNGVPTYFSDAWGIYGLRQGKWRFVMGGNGDLDVKTMVSIGIPLLVARRLASQS